MKQKLKILISLVVVIFIVVLSNIGQMILSNDQFQKHNISSINLKQ